MAQNMAQGPSESGNTIEKITTPRENNTSEKIRAIKDGEKTAREISRQADLNQEYAEDTSKSTPKYQEWFPDQKDIPEERRQEMANLNKEYLDVARSAQKIPPKEREGEAYKTHIHSMDAIKQDQIEIIEEVEQIKTQKKREALLPEEKKEEYAGMNQNIDTLKKEQENIKNQRDALKTDDPQYNQLTEALEKNTAALENLDTQKNELLKKAAEATMPQENLMSEQELAQMETISSAQFLALPEQERLRCVTLGNTPAASLTPESSTKEVNFSFTYNGKFNKELYMNTTAGNVLPKTVGSVTCLGETYTRRGVNGEFYSKDGHRLVIKENTQISVDTFRTPEDITRITKAQEAGLRKYEGKENFDVASAIAQKGYDVDFILAAFPDIIEKVGNKNNSQLESFLNELGRIEGRFAFDYPREMSRDGEKLTPKFAGYLQSMYANENGNTAHLKTSFAKTASHLEGYDSQWKQGFTQYYEENAKFAPENLSSMIQEGGESPSPVVNLARKFIGIPYVWGGTNPNVGLDCSGLTQLVHKQLGINIPRVSKDQSKGGSPAKEPLQPGDLMFFNRKNNGVGHVAIYSGNGNMIEAPCTGKKIHEIPISTYAKKTYVWSRRYSA